MIELRGFGWRHAGRRDWAVRGVDLNIERGERVLLLGRSGAGKSTLLHAMAGLLPADTGTAEGTVKVDGGTGIVFQDPQSQLVMSRAGDEVAFGLENLGWASSLIWPRVDDVLRDVGFPYGRDRNTSELSGGEQQRLVLAGALAPSPNVLLLDEPTANLDPAGAGLVCAALSSLDTFVLVEHRVEKVIEMVNRVVVLEPGGGIVLDGPPSRLSMLDDASLWLPSPQLPVFPSGTPGDRLIWTPTLDILAGGALAITGPNGSGKTTLALKLGGLRPGPVESVWGKPFKLRARELARHIGSVFQNPEHQFVAASVRAEIQDDALLDRLHLSHLASANPFTLSGGEARRLSVATALAAKPQVLILDEPTFGQDRRTWIELVAMLAELRDSGQGIVAVTHDPHVVSSLDATSLELTAVPR